MTNAEIAAPTRIQVGTAEELLAYDANDVFRSDAGCIYVKRNGPGVDGFDETGNSHVHSAADIGLPAELLARGAE